jgi:hypothetical protein
MKALGAGLAHDRSVASAIPGPTLPDRGQCPGQFGLDCRVAGERSAAGPAEVLAGAPLFCLWPSAPECCPLLNLRDSVLAP